MAVTIEMQNTGDARARQEILAGVEHVLSDVAGEWRVSIVGSRANDNWEMKVEGLQGFERSYTLVGEAGEHQPEAIRNVLLKLLPASAPLPYCFALPYSRGRHCRNWLGQFFETVEPAMKKIPNSSRRLSEHILRALNQIRKPSTAGEITELLNHDLDLEERPFQPKDVEEWLRNTEDTALTLYWSRVRPRK